jgi:hypothetical protein
MALQAQAVLDCPFEAVADVGDYHGHEVTACLAAGITPYVSRPITSLMRGLEKVWTECSLTVLAYNLRRVLNLVELPRRLATLG